MLGIWALDGIPWVLWQQKHEKMFSENFREFLENDTMWKPHLTHSWLFQEITVGCRKKKWSFLSLFFTFLSFSPAFLWRTGFSGGRLGEKNGSLKATSGMTITRDNELEHASLPFFLQRSWTWNSVVHAWKFYKHYLNSSQKTFASSGLLLPLLGLSTPTQLTTCPTLCPLCSAAVVLEFSSMQLLSKPAAPTTSSAVDRGGY